MINMNIGVCGSDIHVYHGKHPFTKYPVTQGHEVSGEITELGKMSQSFMWDRRYCLTMDLTGIFLI